MAVLTFITGLLGKLAADEIKAWLPKISRTVLTRALSRLPREQRERYAEEWEAHIADTPGDLSRLLLCFELMAAAVKIASQYKKEDTLLKGYIQSSIAVPVGENWREDFNFDSHPENAWYWPTFEEAQVNCMELNRAGVRIPSSQGGTCCLSDFHVEETAPGEFSLCCEGPFILQEKRQVHQTIEGLHGM
jgi:hypothetical protein